LYASVAGLIGDLVDCQGLAIVQLLNQQWVSKVLQTLKESHSQENREEADWAWQKI
jgi:hypothetical protein